MHAAPTWSWLVVVLLGATHGINPGMGWLFAVALGLQERSARAVWRALGPLALGHAVSVLAAVLVAAVIGLVVPMHLLRWGIAVALLAMAVRTMRGHSHMARGGMRVTRRDLTVWSFLMATAHGAGLMVLPFVIGTATTTADAGGHAGHAAMATASMGSSMPTVGLAMAAVHTIAYLATTGGVAAIVYGYVGVGILRRAWLNLDIVWAASLAVTAGVVILSA